MLVGIASYVNSVSCNRRMGDFPSIGLNWEVYQSLKWWQVSDWTDHYQTRSRPVADLPDYILDSRLITHFRYINIYENDEHRRPDA